MPNQANQVFFENQPKHCLVGLDRNDSNMQAFLKNEYESADVIFISERAAPIAERYFAGVARKPSAQVHVIKSLDKMKEAVSANNWSKLCIVSANELQTLSQKFEQGFRLLILQVLILILIVMTCTTNVSHIQKIIIRMQLRVHM